MKKLLIHCLALCLGAIAPAFSLDEDEVKYRASISEGISLLRGGSQSDIGRAIAKFKTALKHRPESAEAYYWIGLAYSDQGTYSRAADNARNAVVYDEEMPEAWLLWGQSLIYQREWNQALEKLETASRLAPENPLAQYNLGRVYYHGMKNPDTALAKFRSAYQLGQGLRRDNPEMIAVTIRSRLYIGICEYDRGVRQNSPTNFASAIAAFQDVIREQPNNLDARLRLAMALRRDNRSDEAISILEDMRKALGNTGENIDRAVLAEVHLQLADIYLKDPKHRNPMFVPFHLQQFVDLIRDASHPALEPARKYLEDAAKEGMLAGY